MNQGASEIKQGLDTLNAQIKQIQHAVDNLVNLNDSFKGQGAQAIRSFYQECHAPLLLFMEGFMLDYQETLKLIQDSLQSMEPDGNAIIRQDFIQNDVDEGIRHAENVTMGLTDETNTTIQSVNDIVALPTIQDEEFLQQANQSRKNAYDTLEKLHTFDAASTAKLGNVENDIQLMNTYISEISRMFRSGDLSIGDYSVRRLRGYQFHQELIDAVKSKAWNNTLSLEVLLGTAGMHILSQFVSSDVLIHYLQEKYEMRTMDYTVRSLKAISAASGDSITHQEFATIRGQVVNSVEVTDYKNEWQGKYFTLLDGRKAREFTDADGTVSYEFVSEIPEDRFQPEEKSFLEKTWDGVKDVGSTVASGAKEVADFMLLDDVNTLTSSDASLVDKGIAAASIIPVGKVLKLRKVDDILKVDADGVKAKKVDKVEGTGNDYETSKFQKWSNDGKYDKVRAYRGRDLTAYNSEYLVDPRLVVEMNFKGKDRSGTNAAGWERNAKKFFNSLLKSNPEFWSVENTDLIKRGRVPKADDQFLEHFPQYREYIQEPMRHHHIGEGGQAVALPKSLHPGYGGIHNVEKDWGITGVDDEIARRLDTFIKDSGR